MKQIKSLTCSAKLACHTCGGRATKDVVVHDGKLVEDNYKACDKHV